MKPVVALLLIFIALCTLTSCAGYSITHNGEGEGYDVFRPEPYLLVRQGSSAKSASEIIYLPNYSQRYRIHTWNFLAKADLKLDFQDGWCLKGITGKTDNTQIIAKLLDGIRKVTSPETIESLSGEVLLFRLVFDEKTGHFTGLQHVKLIETPSIGKHGDAGTQ